MKKRKSNSFILPLLVPITFFMVLSLCLFSFYRFEYDPDEGINVMKALLLSRGYALYEDIWSDQPPLFTHILSLAFQIFGATIHVARPIVLCFSCILLWGVWRFLDKLGGPAYAFSGSLLVIFLPYFSNLSLSVMVGLPALSLAMVSFWTISLWSRNKKTLWIVISAFCLSLSVLIKANTIFLAPIAIVGISLTELFCKKAGPWSKRILPATVWTLTFVVTIAVLTVFFVGIDNISQLTQGHMDAQQIGVFKKMTIYPYLKTFLPTLLLAVIGAVAMILNKKWEALYLISWCGIAYVILLNHAPVWYHHQLLISIPAAMLAGCAIGEVVNYFPLFLKQRIVSWRGLLTGVVAVGFLFILLNQVPIAYDKFDNRALKYPKKMMKNLQSYDLVEKMSHYRHNTQWVFTDRPMYAFRSGLLVPPEIAVMSSKRLKTGDITEKKMRKILQLRRPEQVLLARFKYKKIEMYLKQDYKIIYSRNRTKLFIRKDMYTSL